MFAFNSRGSESSVMERGTARSNREALAEGCWKFQTLSRLTTSLEIAHVFEIDWEAVHSSFSVGDSERFVCE